MTGASMLLREFGSVYRALAMLGIGPRDADLLEVWEVAAVLGAPAAGDAAAPALTGDALIAERVRRHRAGLPPLQATPVSPGGPLMRRLRSV